MRVDPRPGGAAPPLSGTRLQRAAKDFEALFLQEMLKAMRATVPEGGLLDAGQGEDMFTAMLDEHVARISADRSERGLGQALYQRFREAAGEGA